MTGSAPISPVPPPSFFFADEEESKPLQNPKMRPSVNTALPATKNGLSRVSSRSSEPPSIDDILLFPVENSHAYSYAHLSPNSLALRLNVLKRSLEILNERPDWVRSIHNEDDAEDVKPEKRQFSANRQRFYQSASHNDSGESLLLGPDKFKLSSNASSAALSALFRPKLQRTESLPSWKMREVEKKEALRSVSEKKAEKTDKNEAAQDSFTDELKDLIDVIESDANLLSSQPEIATTLHNLSLSTGTEGTKKKQSELRTKLLFALATPFVESSIMTNSLLGTSMPSSASSFGSALLPNASSVALNFLNPSYPGASSQATANRPFHAFTAGKHASPQSIVTVEADFPWSFKAANDMACLMFGVSNNMIKNLTLIDLIAPQFRNFITERMTKMIGDFADRKSTERNNIIFAGEIVAISRHAEGDFAWVSIWAKKTGNIIICSFEQITCDAFDLVLSCDLENYPQQPYSITSIDEIAGKLITKSDMRDVTELHALSNSLGDDLRRSAAQNADNEECDWADSRYINSKRYYTLQLKNGDNVPCALTSDPLEKDENKVELKVKIHSMPYIGGMFVVDFSNYKILSCNKAIAKNLFGVSYTDIIDHAIDEIIPQFKSILKAGLDDQDEAISIVPGLVLPEHFFRKYFALLESGSGNADELFLKSRGIKALHRDGKHLFIDVQLRVISSDVFVLWVTYSRHLSKDIHKHLDTLSNSHISGITSPRKQRSNSNVVNLPSQMKLFAEVEPEMLEFGSREELVRHSSTRRPKRASTFALPLAYMRATSKSKETDSQETISIGDTTVDTSGDELSRPSTRMTQDSGKSGFKIYKEEEILSFEEKELEAKRKASKFWPTTIGERKRTKKFSEFNVLKKLGEGAYGKVVLAEHKDDPAYRIIIKCIDKSRILVDTWVRDRQLGTIPSEIQIMAVLNSEPHPNIMRIVDYFEDPEYYYLETPIFGDPPAIDLFDYIEVKSDMSELDCRLIFKQVVSAVYHLHKEGIAHRDIKDENIIVNEVGVVKLIDFGSASYVKSGPFDVFVGTIDYASPEVLRGEKYEGKPQDVWALGILLYTMIYKENPFYNVDEIMKGELRVPYVVSENSLNLIRMILCRDVQERPTITDIAEHPWLEVDA